MKLINLKNKYYINTDYISFIETNSKLSNNDEINNFNKKLNTLPSKLFGPDWMYTLKIPIKRDERMDIALTYTYIEAQDAEEYIQQSFFKAFKDLIINRANLTVPNKKYITEYTIHFINTTDVIVDTFSSDDLSVLGISVLENTTTDTDECIKFFRNFE